MTKYYGSSAAELERFSIEHPQSREQLLEAMVDAIGLKQVLYLLSNIASAKAEHVLTNWQDSRLGKAWEAQAARLDAFAHKTNGVPPIG